MLYSFINPYHPQHVQNLFTSKINYLFISRDNCLKKYQFGRVLSIHYLSKLDWNLIDRLRTLHSSVSEILANHVTEYTIEHPIIRVNKVEEKEIKCLLKKIVSTEHMLGNRLFLDTDSIYKVFKIKKVITTLKK